MNHSIPIVQVGLGPIGLELMRLIATRPALSIVAAVDIDPALTGRTLSELADATIAPAVSVQDNLAGSLASTRARGGVAIVSTGSRLEAIMPTLYELIGHGLHVVSTCEQLSYPWQTHSAVAQRIDEAAREAGVAVIGTGVNPGFLMDLLPVTLSGMCRQVRHVHVERVQDAAARRLPFQRKVGAGLDAEQFEARVREGTLRHVGLAESMHMIAAALGWELARVEDHIEPALADCPVEGPDGLIATGFARGVEQTGLGFVNDREVIRLTFRAAVGEPECFERIRLDADPPVDMQIEGGINGDVATAAVVVNTVEAITRARPGLRTMIDIPSPASRGV